MANRRDDYEVVCSFLSAAEKIAEYSEPVTQPMWH